MRHRLFVHLTWTTRDRAPLVDRRVAGLLDQMLRATAIQERARVLELGMVTTHVHVLLRLHPAVGLSRLIQRFKGSTARVANRDLGARLHWARGYSIESVSVRAVWDVREYVRRQAEHHPDQAIEGWPAERRDCGPTRRGLAAEEPRLGESVR